MSMTLQETERLQRMEDEVRQRPNGLRVLRLLRELSYLDGQFTSSMRHAWEFPLVTAALTAGLVVLVMTVLNLPPAQSASAPVSGLAVVDIRADQEAASARQAQEYMDWLRDAHARAAQDGAASVAESF